MASVDIKIKETENEVEYVNPAEALLKTQASFNLSDSIMTQSP